MNIQMEPIGYIKSAYQTREGISRQSKYAEDETAVLELLPEFRTGAQDIQVGDYIIILFYFHQSAGYQMRFTKHGADAPIGVFSTRSPNRPNGIGMSIVKVLENEETGLKFQGVDMLDGTPVLDIKPYSAGLNPKE